MVVEARPLPRHPGEHPRVQVLVLVDQLVAAPVPVDVDERLPDLRALDDLDGELLELGGGEEAVVGNEVIERRIGGSDERRH